MAQATANIPSRSLVWGRQGKQTPVEQVRAFLRLKPDAQLTIIESAAMLSQEEQSDTFLKNVEGFLSAR